MKSLNIVRVTGGLGNQLSAYAYARCVAKAKGVEVKLDITPYTTAKILGWPMHNGYELQTLFGVAAEASLLDIVRAGGHRYYARVGWRKLTGRPDVHQAPVYVELFEHRSIYHEFFADTQYTYYHGFFIHHQYFKNCEAELRHTFSFPQSTDTANLNTLEAIRSSNSVAIHLRRADTVAAVYGANLAYYRRAIDHIRSNVTNPHFFIFSNDPGWCQETLSLPEATYVTHNRGQQAYRDLELMSQCQHLIMPASTFSFWAGLLRPNNAAGIVVCPADWYGAGYSLKQHPAPPEWVRL